MDCGVGRHQSDVGQTSCDECELGRFSNGTGKIQCDACAAGTYQDARAQLECKRCSKGTFAALAGQAVCDVCIVGKYSQVSGATMCQNCDPGSYNDELAAVQCKPCAAGRAQPLPGHATCVACDVGLSNPSPGQTRCLPCSIGRFANASGQTTCTPCYEGTSMPSTGAVQCSECARGRAVSTRGQAYCSLCSLGTHAPIDGLSECRPCSEGTYGDEVGAETCKDCPMAEWTYDAGQSICTPCPTGTFGNATGCNLCPPGTYNNLVRASSCRPCAPGRFSGSWGQDECLSCALNDVATNYGMAKCQPCRAHGKSNLERTECACEPGFYLPYYLQDSIYRCVPCPVGGDCTSSGTTYYNLKSLPGWWRSSNSSLNFYRCPIRSNCQGSEAMGGAAQYTSGPTTDQTLAYMHNRTQTMALAPMGHASDGATRGVVPSESLAFRPLSSDPPNNGGGDGGVSPPTDVCGPPYFECSTQCTGSRAAALCTQCLEGYRDTMGGACQPCPTGSANVFVTVLIVLVILFALWLMFYVVLRSGRQAFHSHTTSMNEESMMDDIVSDMEDEESDGESWMDEDSDASDSDVCDSSSGVSSSRASGASTPSDSHPSSMTSGTSSDTDVEAEVDAYDAESSTSLDAMSVYGPPPPPSDFTYKLKIFLGFLQVVTNISSGLEIQWPNTFKDFVLLFDVVNMDFLLSNVTSAQCLFSYDFYYKKFTFVVVAPVALLLVTVVFILLPKYFECLCFKHATVQERARSTMKFWKLFLYLLFLIYPNVSSTVLRHFVCKQIDDRAFLWTDLRVQCYTDRWTTFAFVAIALILLYPVGIPVFFFALLQLNKKDLKESRIKAQLGFLYAGFSAECWWWELIDCVNKLALTSMLAFAPPQAQLQLGMVICTLYTVLLLYFSPYLRHEDDLLALFAQVEIYLLLLAGLVYYNLPLGSSNMRDDLIMSSALILLCLGFFCGFLWFITMIARKMWKTWQERRRRKKTKEEQREARIKMREEKWERKEANRMRKRMWMEEEGEEDGQEQEMMSQDGGYMEQDGEDREYEDSASYTSQSAGADGLDTNEYEGGNGNGNSNGNGNGSGSSNSNSHSNSHSDGTGDDIDDGDAHAHAHAYSHDTASHSTGEHDDDDDEYDDQSASASASRSHSATAATAEGESHGENDSDDVPPSHASPSETHHDDEKRED